MLTAHVICNAHGSCDLQKSLPATEAPLRMASSHKEQHRRCWVNVTKTGRCLDVVGERGAIIDALHIIGKRWTNLDDLNVVGHRATTTICAKQWTLHRRLLNRFPNATQGWRSINFADREVRLSRLSCLHAATATNPWRPKAVAKGLQWRFCVVLVTATLIGWARYSCSE